MDAQFVIISGMRVNCTNHSAELQKSNTGHLFFQGFGCPLS